MLLAPQHSYLYSELELPTLTQAIVGPLACIFFVVLSFPELQQPFGT